MHILTLNEWSFIPGPESDPPTSSLDLRELVEYPPELVAEAILSFSGMVVQNPGQPTWWDWSAKWQHNQKYIEIGMTLFDTESSAWGGSPLQAYCEIDDLLALWDSIRRKCLGVWMHNSNCEIHTPKSFRELFP